MLHFHHDQYCTGCLLEAHTSLYFESVLQTRNTSSKEECNTWILIFDFLIVKAAPVLSTGSLSGPSVKKDGPDDAPSCQE